jgi:hypothetical protein
MAKGFILPLALAATIAAGGIVAWFWPLPQGVAQSQAAEEAVRNSLKDPDSAMFRGITVYRDGMVCGQVNAKNSMGGYVGFKLFMVRDGKIAIDDDEADTNCNYTAQPVVTRN